MTKEILKFINRHFTIPFPEKRLTPGSKNIIKNIVSQMELAVASFGQIEARILDTDEEIKGPEYEYMIEDAKTELANKHRIGKRYTFIIGSRTIVIYAIYPVVSFSKKREIYSFLDAAIKKMYVWLFVANHFANTDCSPHLTIYWYLTDLKKLLPVYKDNVIDREHVNTGFTLACPRRQNSIYIFRKEEWFKVFIHESFHSLGLDFASMPETPANEAMFSIFPVHFDLRFSEAYTEAWAEIIHVLFISVSEYPCNHSVIKIDKLVDTIQSKMENERKWSMFQLAKILNHNRVHYRDLFTPNGYKEESNVFSYFVLKSIFVFFYNDFVEWSGSIAFKQTQENILGLVGFIREHCKHPDYMKTIDDFEKKIQKVPDDPAMKTMRMSITE